MAKLFNSIAVSAPGRNKFDLSHEKKLTMNMGPLIPILAEEVVPGDKFRVNTEVLIRFAPLAAPMMHRVNCYVHYFFVPNRLIWNEWEDFITGGVDGQTAPIAPNLTIGAGSVQADLGIGSLADYLGVPDLTGATIVGAPKISALPFRAYAEIFNQYYRDQTLTPEIDYSKASGQLTALEWDKIKVLRKRAWEKDYFTSALPFSQRGGEVTMPIAGTGTVTYLPTSFVKVPPGGGPAPAQQLTSDAAGNFSGTTTATLRLENIDEVILNNATTTINDLRRAVRLQEWLEKMARGGSRYAEQMLVMFGVKSSDARLQRPEYLGGGRQPVVVSEVLSTFGVDGVSPPQGNLAGHGISVGARNGFNRFFEEHGWVIGILSILPRTGYQQGLHKKFSRFDKLDYYWSSFANLGEQEIRNKEIYMTGDEVADEVTFGYTPRYAEYKYGCSTTHGQFKSSLAFWHQNRIFASAPALNQAFIESDPTQRVFAVTDPAIDQLYIQLYHKIDALRPMPYFGTPTL